MLPIECDRDRGHRQNRIGAAVFLNEEARLRRLLTPPSSSILPREGRGCLPPHQNIAEHGLPQQYGQPSGRYKRRKDLDLLSPVVKPHPSAPKRLHSTRWNLDD
ncbi:hypothetical protein KEJ39_01500 [Candidatus Bathyarchaeota archaeon]|nr:hypothetical protein [Candidatus Bathyarchaeota archaeon]